MAVMILSNQSDDIHAWPVPDSHAQRQSLELAGLIHEEIDANHGRISFKRYMELALYEPGLGYYSGGARKFGPDGDFMTAPEISPLFSRCLARQCEQVLELTGDGTILELGAGTGLMAADILAELERRNTLPEAYLILEPGADLKQRQQQLLQERVPQLFSRIAWLDELPASPVNGVILANEVLDALPVQRIRITGGEIQEVFVVADRDAFFWEPGPAEETLSAHIHSLLSGSIRQLPEGYTTEYSPLNAPLIYSLSDSLGTGAMFLIDYGYPRPEYYHPQRLDGTLQCYYRHRVHSDPFLYPGIQDITASVDFTLVAESAGVAGLEVSGFTTQAGFLIACGLDEIVLESAENDANRLLKYAQQARQLVLPGEMGENVKVMALGRNIQVSLKGFEFADHLHRL